MKNSCRVKFDEYLDLSSYTTSGALSTTPSLPISSPTPSTSSSRSSTPTPSLYSRQQTIYRLSAVVCHYGQHSFGHYIAYRRKPRPELAGTARWTPPRLSCPLDCQCEKCVLFGPIRDDYPPWSSSRRGGGWLRISDASVEEVGIETVLAEQSGTFMLYYERVLPPLLSPPVPYAESVRTRSSEETIIATPTPPPAAHITAQTHAPERRKRTHSAANNESEEDRMEIKLQAERLTGPNPRPDLHFPRINGEHVCVEPRLFRSTSLGIRASGSQGSRSRSSSGPPLPPPVENGMSAVNGHAAAATVQRPTHAPKANGTIVRGPHTKQVQSSRRKKQKKNSISTRDVNINGGPSRTFGGSGMVD